MNPHHQPHTNAALRSEEESTAKAPFLQLVAQDLYAKLGSDLSRTAIVFPNKRAGLFFNEHLVNQSDKPIWSPAYISISELFQRLSDEKLGDSIRLVCELYKIFREETGSEETLDDFYFWGELLISDFDDVDKNLVDAHRLFTNLQELKNIMDDFEFLDNEQEAAIQQFFQNFSIDKRTQLKEKFISLWDKLGVIYHRYQSRLKELGIAYEGMLYRECLSSLNPDRQTLLLAPTSKEKEQELMRYDKYVFVGFNVLNKVEQRFFEILQNAGKAMFYWDYDHYYTQPSPLLSKGGTERKTSSSEAGEFILRNLRLFPNELPQELFDCLRHPKKIRFISSPTENAQARYLPQWIKSIGLNNHDTAAEQASNQRHEKENAVVLCNETLLLPVLHSIPQEVSNVNVTMGFPLAQTPVYSFINALVELQTDGYQTESGRYTYEAVIGILKHPYSRRLSPQVEQLEKELTGRNRFYPLPSELKRDEFLTLLFTPRSGIHELCLYVIELLRAVSTLYRQESSTDDIFNQLYRESLFKSFTMVNRLLSLIEGGELPIRTDTWKRLLNRLLTSANVPFHGEPAIGMQVMGVLETRNLDFRNLLLLSLNEGQLPKAGADSSFIPYNLRKAFGMTTIEHKNSVYAYYFYRLIQRAENITLVYNSSSDGLNRSEWSRFMLQLLVEWPHEISREYLEAGQSPQTGRTIRIEKTPEILQRMYSAYDLNRNPKAFKLSPSALNAYLDCRLRFYYRYVAAIETPKEVSAEIDSALFGTIFHRSAELAYTDLCSQRKEIHKDDIERLLRDEVRLQGYVDRAFKEELFKVALDERPEYNGVQLIHSKVIGSYLRQLLRNDLLYTPFTMVGMEVRTSEEWMLHTATESLSIRIGGIIDRIDTKDDTLRIVDYKTGGTPKIPASVEQLFTPAEGRPNYIFQTFLYAAIMSRKQGLKVAPALLYIHRAAGEDYSPVIEMGEPRKPKMPINNFTFFEDEFRERMQSLLEELFSVDAPFTQTEHLNQCEYCDFRRLCKR